MPETLQNPESIPKEPQSSKVTIAVAAGVLAAIVLSVLFFVAPSHLGTVAPRQPGVTLKMAPAEQEYVRNIRVEKIALSRAENFIHQEVTILDAEVVNGGPQAVQALLLTVEFHDEFGQLALRETRTVLGTPPVTLAPGESRPIEISFDNVPASWNLQQPAVRVYYLQLK